MNEAKVKRACQIVAKEALDIDTLETRGRDCLDFHDLSVIGIERALRLAYRLGHEDAMADPQPAEDQCHGQPEPVEGAPRCEICGYDHETRKCPSHDF